MTASRSKLSITVREVLRSLAYETRRINATYIVQVIGKSFPEPAFNGYIYIRAKSESDTATNRDYRGDSAVQNTFSLQGLEYIRLPFVICLRIEICKSNSPKSVNVKSGPSVVSIPVCKQVDHSNRVEFNVT